MPQRDAFAGCHPAVNFVYFSLTAVFSVCLMHPVSLVLSLSGAVCYSILLRGKKAWTKSWRFLLPVVLLAAVLNPAFSHQGATVLLYLPTGNPLTLESILYGLAAAVLLAAVFLWFACWNDVLTSDKIVYLFGRAVPALSLLLSMTLRFVPRFRAQLHRVAQAQTCLRGGKTVQGGQRLKNGVAILSVLVTWSLENAVETADSMKSRGYGLPGRTAFALYRLDRRDKGLLLWIALLGACLAAGWAMGGLTYDYYPVLTGAWSPFSLCLFLAEFLLFFTPVLLRGWEARQWKKQTSAGL